ncbi:MAG: Yip1 family protein [Porticoccaceae bacterium]
MFGHILGLLFYPRTEWRKIANLSDEKIKRLLPYPILMSLLPALGFYIGTTKIGWTVSGENVVRITEASAIPLAVLTYAALLGAIIFIGLMVNWMSQTYLVKTFPIKGIVAIGYACTPIFLAGAFAAYPIWWLDITLGIAAGVYTIYLIYMAIPLMMHVPGDRGFLYASAVFMVALVYVVVVLVSITIIWEYIATPVFID